jgi:hypothetical protein
MRVGVSSPPARSEPPGPSRLGASEEEGFFNRKGKCLQVTVRDEAIARQYSGTGSLEVCAIVALTLGLGMFVLGASAVAVVVFGLLSASLVSLGRARTRGWSPDRLGVTTAFVVGTVLFALASWAVAGIVGALVVGLGSWLTWHVGVGRRVRQL